MLAQIHYSLVDAVRAGSAKLSNGKGGAYGAEVFLKCDDSCQMRACQASGERVHLRVVQQKGLFENQNTLSLLKFWERFQDLCNSQGDVFWDDFARVVDDKGADAGRANRTAKHDVYAVFLKLMRCPPFNNLIQHART